MFLSGMAGEDAIGSSDRPKPSGFTALRPVTGAFPAGHPCQSPIFDPGGLRAFHDRPARRHQRVTGLLSPEQWGNCASAWPLNAGWPKQPYRRTGSQMGSISATRDARLVPLMP